MHLCWCSATWLGCNRMWRLGELIWWWWQYFNVSDCPIAPNNLIAPTQIIIICLFNWNCCWMVSDTTEYIFRSWLHRESPIIFDLEEEALMIFLWVSLTLASLSVGVQTDLLTEARIYCSSVGTPEGRSILSTRRKISALVTSAKVPKLKQVQMELLSWWQFLSITCNCWLSWAHVKHTRPFYNRFHPMDYFTILQWILLSFRSWFVMALSHRQLFASAGLDMMSNGLAMYVGI